MLSVLHLSLCALRIVLLSKRGSSYQNLLFNPLVLATASTPPSVGLSAFASRKPRCLAMLERSVLRIYIKTDRQIERKSESVQSSSAVGAHPLTVSALCAQSRLHGA